MSFTTLLTKWLGKSIAGVTIGTIWSYVKWGIIATIIGLVSYNAYKFYNHYNDLTKAVESQANTIKNLNATLEILQNTNIGLNKTVGLAGDSGKINTDTVAELADKKEKVKTDFDTVQNNRKLKEQKLKSKPVKIVKDNGVEKELNLTDEEKASELSRIRIDSIWISYCKTSGAQNNQECK